MLYNCKNQGDEVVQDQPDAELLAASGADPEAFRILYQRHSKPLLRYLQRRTLDAEVSVELLAETFAKAYERRNQHKPARGTVSAWLHGIARHELQHFFRKRQVQLKAVQRLGVQLPPPTADTMQRVDEIVDAQRLRVHVAAALAELSPKEREAVRLRVVEEFDYPAVAARLDCSEQAARVRVHRGLGRLKRHLEGFA